MTLHGVRSKSLKLGRLSHSKEADNAENLNQTEMEESEGIQAIVFSVSYIGYTYMD